MEQLFLAIGNPDTGSSSEAWTAFNDTLKAAVAGRKDETRIRETAHVVLDYLAAAQSALDAAVPLPTPRVDPAPTPPPVSWDWKQEWGAMLTGIGQGVVAMRDGGLAGDATAIALGSSRMNNALLDRFYPPNTWTMPDGRAINASGTRFERSARSGPGPPGRQPRGAPVIAHCPSGSRWTSASRRISIGVRLADLPAGRRRDVPPGDRSHSRRQGRRPCRVRRNDCRQPVAGGVLRQAGARHPIVRVTTATSPFMAGWREIEIQSPDLPLPTMIAMATPRPAPLPPSSAPGRDPPRRWPCHPGFPPRHPRRPAGRGI